MSRETWRLIKSSKLFYINTYRRAGSILVVSVSLNLLLGLVVAQAYFSRSAIHFYATNGTTSPEEIIAMDIPNMTSAPILADDLSTQDVPKVIPQ